MIKELKNIIIFAVALILMAIGFRSGYNLYPKQHPCQVITTGIREIHDTTQHYNYYIWPVWQDPDTIIYHDTIPGEIDSAEVVRNFYAEHYYTRHFDDTLLEAELTDIITRNRPTKSTFTYRILRPQTVINNSVTTTTWNKYLCVGMNINTYNPRLTGFELMFVTPRVYLGGGYMPVLKGFNIKAGGTILKLKKTQ